MPKGKPVKVVVMTPDNVNPADTSLFAALAAVIDDFAEAYQIDDSKTKTNTPNSYDASDELNLFDVISDEDAALLQSAHNNMVFATDYLRQVEENLMLKYKNIAESKRTPTPTHSFMGIQSQFETPIFSRKNEKTCESSGKIQNNSGCAKCRGYAETAGKIQNNSGENKTPDYAETVGKIKNNSGENKTPDYAEIAGVHPTGVYVDEAHLVSGMENRITRYPSKPKLVHTNKLEKLNTNPLDNFLKMLHKNEGKHFCQDKAIVAVLHDGENGFVTVASNGIVEPQVACLRNDLQLNINEGYEICAEHCKQPNHAEMDAVESWLQMLELSGKTRRGAIMHVFGAKKICASCQQRLDSLGVYAIVEPDLSKVLDYIF